MWWDRPVEEAIDAAAPTGSKLVTLLQERLAAVIDELQLGLGLG